MVLTSKRWLSALSLVVVSSAAIVLVGNLGGLYNYVWLDSREMRWLSTHLERGSFRGVS